MPKIVSWTPEQAKENLNKFLRLAKDYRVRTVETQWSENENMLYNAIGFRQKGMNQSFDNFAELSAQDIEQNEHDVGVNYIFRHWRFIHAQMSANPPVAIAGAATGDVQDIRAANAADALIHHFRKTLNIQEVIDRVSSKTLSKGTGWIKVYWDDYRGKVKSTDKQTNEIEMTGDIHLYSPSSWNVWVDPDATIWEEAKYLIEQHDMEIDDAVFRFPEQEAALRAAMIQVPTRTGFFRTQSIKTSQKDVVRLFEYWEKARPVNGMVGRHGWFLEDGTLLRPLEANPTHNREIPYFPLTDIDVEDQIYGKSFIEYEAPIQDIINRLDGTTLDGIRAHSVIRMFLPSGCEIADESITDASLDIIKGQGNVPPTFISPPGSMPDHVRLRQMLEGGGEAIAGVNESMFGQVKREMSGFSLQTAINAGNMVRRRLFNKYTLMVEFLYRTLIGLVVQKWDVPRMVQTVGDENAFNVIAIKGSDVEAGFDIRVDYGTSFSLDPASRREEIMQLWPILKEAGIPPKLLISNLKLNDISTVYDRVAAAKNRQQEIFDIMIDRYHKGIVSYIAPEELQDHQGMIEYAAQFLMSAEFRDLPEEVKALIRQHVKDREQLAAQDATGGAPAPQEAQVTPEQLAIPPVVPGA